MEDKLSYWIHLLLEGELDESKEVEVFTALAQHPELRAEFRHLVIMNRALREKAVRMPPPQLTQSLFQRLPFSRRFNKPWALFLLFGSGILTGLLLAFWLFSSSLFFKDTSSATASTWRPNQDLPIVEMLVPDSNIQDHRKLLYAQTNTGALDATRPPAATTIFEVPITENLDNDGTGHWIGPSTIHTPSVLPILSSERQLQTQPLRHSSLSPTGMISDLSFLHHTNIDYREQFSLFSTPQIRSVTPTTNRNFHLAVGYPIAPSHTIGIAIGRENFPQRFYLEAHQELNDQHEETEVYIHYEQNPTLWWVAAFYRYRWQLSSWFQPFTELAVGGTAVGPLTKAVLGTSISITDYLSAYAGLESSLLLYQTYEKVFATHKVGLVYGLTIGF